MALRLRLDEADADAIVPVSIGTGIWLIALLVLVIERPALEAAGTSWWIGAAVVGVVSGAGGVVFLVWRKRRMTARQSGVTEL